MFHRILVGFDGSAHSRRAIQVAIDLAVRYHAHLTLVTVFSDRVGPADAELAQLVPIGEDHKPLRTQLNEAQADARSKGVPDSDAVSIHGDVAEAMLEFLSVHPYDLVVVGSRGLSRRSRFFLGSVSSRLVERAPCPVLVVRVPHRGAVRRSPSGPAAIPDRTNPDVPPRA
ncbi:MAG: universal stress protein [Thermoplasmata archaeon]